MLFTPGFPSALNSTPHRIGSRAIATIAPASMALPAWGGRKSHAGFSLADLVVILLVVALLAGFLLPSITVCGGSSRKQNCGSNQRQIVLAMMVYQNDNDQRYPVYPVAGDGTPIPATDPRLDAVATTLATFEYLAFVTGGDLNRKCFACPSRPEAKPTCESGDFKSPGARSAWALDGTAHAGYSFDWSVPKDAESRRVITADRDREVHKGQNVMAVYADGHVGSVRKIDGTFRNPEMAGDDIYSDVGDGHMAMPGGGSATRAFVR